MSNRVGDLSSGNLGGVSGKSEWDSTIGVPDGFGVLLDEAGGLSVGYLRGVEWAGDWVDGCKNHQIELNYIRLQVLFEFSILE